MIPETTQQIIQLYQSGMAKRAIARKLAINVKTVRRILRHDLPSDKPQVKAGKLTAYQEIIKSKVKQGLTGNRILRELREVGYDGGRTILLDYIRKLRGNSQVARRWFCRFETPPAQEAQVDWSPYRVLIASKEVRVHCFSMILANSRYLFIQFHRNEKLPTLLSAHVAAFDFFGGVTRRIVYDNMTTVTLGRKRRKVIWHPEFNRFAKYYAFEPYACRPRDPNRKGKVENPFFYVENDFLQGTNFDSWDHLDHSASLWLSKIANRRRHGTTQLIPEEAWMAERELLTGLPQTPFPFWSQEARRVGEDGLIRVDGTRYSVPLYSMGSRRSVTLRIYPRRVEILNRQGQVIATHKKPDFPGKVIINHEHYQAIRRRPQVKPGEYEARFLARFEHAEEFLDGLKERMKGLSSMHLAELLKLAQIYGDEPISQAMLHAGNYGNFNAYAINRILRQRFPLILPQQHEEPLCLNQSYLEDVQTGSFEDYRQYSSTPANEDEDGKEAQS